MNLYKLIRIFYHKVVFLIYTKLIANFPLRLDYARSIDIKNNKLNLILFTLETLNISEFKTLLLNLNHLNIATSVEDFLDYTSPSFIHLFDSEGNLVGWYRFLIHKPNCVNAELNFHIFASHFMDDIIKHCVYDTMIKNVPTNKYKFYIHISNNSI